MCTSLNCIGWRAAGFFCRFSGGGDKLKFGGGYGGLSSNGSKTRVKRFTNGQIWSVRSALLRTTFDRAKQGTRAIGLFLTKWSERSGFSKTKLKSTVILYFSRTNFWKISRSKMCLTRPKFFLTVDFFAFGVRRLFLLIFQDGVIFSREGKKDPTFLREEFSPY